MKKLLVILGATVAIALMIVALRTPKAPSPVTTANAAEVATTSAPQIPPPPVVIVPPTPEPTTTATTAAPAPSVTAYDPFAHREEIEAAAARGDVSALPELQKIDLTANGYVAAAAIDAVGKLAALAPEKEKREAVRTLDKWMQQEMKRKAPESLGNVSICVDALQDSKSDAAVAPLVAALDSATLPLHIETRIVEALSALNATSAIAPVQRFVLRVKAKQPQDDFDKQLVIEALGTADAALKKWSQ